MKFLFPVCFFWHFSLSGSIDIQHFTIREQILKKKITISDYETFSNVVEEAKMVIDCPQYDKVIESVTKRIKEVIGVPSYNGLAEHISNRNRLLGIDAVESVDNYIKGMVYDMVYQDEYHIDKKEKDNDYDGMLKARILAMVVEKLFKEVQEKLWKYDDENPDDLWVDEVLMVESKQQNRNKTVQRFAEFIGRDGTKK